MVLNLATLRESPNTRLPHRLKKNMRENECTKLGISVGRGPPHTHLRGPRTRLRAWPREEDARGQAAEADGKYSPEPEEPLHRPRGNTSRFFPGPRSAQPRRPLLHRPPERPASSGTPHPPPLRVRVPPRPRPPRQPGGASSSVTADSPSGAGRWRRRI